MYSVGYDDSTYTNPNSSLDYETSTVTFHEPFTGTMSYAIDTKGSPSNTAAYGLIVNGTKDDGTTGHMVPRAGASHKKPWAKTKLIKGVKDAFDAGMWLWDVAAEAGDTLEMAWDAVVGEAPLDAVMTLSDVAPEVIELAGLV